MSRLELGLGSWAEEMGESEGEGSVGDGHGG